MAATVQCLRAIPELQLAMEKSNLTPSDPQSSFVGSLKDLFTQLSKSGDAVFPFAFVNQLRQMVPRFNEQSRGGYAQQDAEECWGEMVSLMRGKVNGFDAQYNSDGGSKFIEQFMCGQLSVRFVLCKTVSNATKQTKRCHRRTKFLRNLQ